jgi:hypothetical protein
VFSDCRTARLRKFELSLEGSSLFAMSAPPRKLDLVAFKTDFPSLHEFYHSWARLKKSDAADFQRQVFFNMKTRLAFSPRLAFPFILFVSG